MTRIEAFIAGVSIVAAFAMGAWAENQRVRDHYMREGEIKALYHVAFDGYMVYLRCLGDDCTKEKAISDAIVAVADMELKKRGVPRRQ